MECPKNRELIAYRLNFVLGTLKLNTWRSSEVVYNAPIQICFKDHFMSKFARSIFQYRALAVRKSGAEYCPYLIVRYFGGEIEQQSLPEQSYQSRSNAIAFVHQYMRGIIGRESFTRR